MYPVNLGVCVTGAKFLWFLGSVLQLSINDPSSSPCFAALSDVLLVDVIPTVTGPLMTQHIPFTLGAPETQVRNTTSMGQGLWNPHFLGYTSCSSKRRLIEDFVSGSKMGPMQTREPKSLYPLYKHPAAENIQID